PAAKKVRVLKPKVAKTNKPSDKKVVKKVVVAPKKVDATPVAKKAVKPATKKPATSLKRTPKRAKSLSFTSIWNPQINSNFGGGVQRLMVRSRVLTSSVLVEESFNSNYLQKKMCFLMILRQNGDSSHEYQLPHIQQ
ncbi:hypothetical protein KI387_021653, partial [Taxus chinensis]